MFSITEEGLEDIADNIKVVVLKALVRDGIVDPEVADKWAEKHTVLHRNKSIFRTLTDKWGKEKTEDNKYYFIVVGG